MKNTQLQTLQKHLDEINKTMSDIKDEIDSINTVVDSNVISETFEFASVQIRRYKNLPEKIVSYLPKFTQDRIQGEDLSELFGTLSRSSLTSDKHGYSMKTTQKSPEAEFSPPVKQLLDEPETITTTDTGFGQLFNVACLSNEKIWTSGSSNTMKLFSINEGPLLKSIKTKSGKTPYDIAVTKSGDLVYTDNIDRM
ncbi:uncharacterized protein LOC134281001 [Saccostrea cucullata]|uniref:uncharacterized protein LOC134281001 n=1 Tax=Saccostrea cuccullata TaxID=36930 RepID=UPI002ED24C26